MSVIELTQFREENSLSQSVAQEGTKQSVTLILNNHKKSFYQHEFKTRKVN